jgi:hypothetical protein
MPLTVSGLKRFEKRIIEEQERKNYFDKLTEWLRWMCFTGQHHSHSVAAFNVRYAYVLSAESEDG